MILRQKSRVNFFLVLGLSVLCLVLIAMGVVLFLRNAHPEDVLHQFQVEGLDPAAETGTLSGGFRGGKTNDSGAFYYRLNTTLTVKADGTGGDLHLENPKGNDYLMVLELCLAGQDTVLFHTQFLAPNQYIKSIDLPRPLSEGKHDAVAYINAVDPETLDTVGTLECPITIQVKA